MVLAVDIDDFNNVGYKIHGMPGTIIVLRQAATKRGIMKKSGPGNTVAGCRSGLSC
jgi:hypothetical protein